MLLIRNASWSSFRAIIIVAALPFVLQSQVAAHDNGELPAHYKHIRHFPFGKPGQLSKIDRTVPVVIKDNALEMDCSEMRSRQTVRFVIRNESAVDRDFILGDRNTLTIHRNDMAKSDETGKPMPRQRGGNSVMVPKGKTEILVWQLAGPGNLRFDSNVPGHFAPGMIKTVPISQ